MEIKKPVLLSSLKLPLQDHSNKVRGARAPRPPASLLALGRPRPCPAKAAWPF